MRIGRDSSAGVSASVLLVDSDAAERDDITAALLGAGFGARAEPDGSGLRVVLRRSDPDLAIVEVRPRSGPDGYGMARILREHDVPVILLAAADRLEDRLAGFQAGAEDCIGRPFSTTELVARAHAILRLAGRLRPPELRWGDLVVSDSTRQVTRSGHPVELTRTEFDLLCALLRTPGRVLSKRQLLTGVWGTDDASDNVVEAHLSALRRKLEEHGPRMIDTVRGVGYICRERRVTGGRTRTAAPPPGSRTPYPLTLENCGSIETFTRPPARVLTQGALPTTAVLVQLGLRDRIVKTAIYSTRSDVPGMAAELASLDRVHVPGLGVPRQEVIALRPDLVIGGQDSYFQPERGYASRAELHAAGIQAYAPGHLRSRNVDRPPPELLAADHGATIDAHLQTIVELGRIFDVGDRAARLVADIRDAIDAVRSRVAHLRPVRVTITDPTIADTARWAGTFHVYCGRAVDELLAAAGGLNVWADAPRQLPLGADRAGRSPAGRSRRVRHLRRRTDPRRSGGPPGGDVPVVAGHPLPPVRPPGRRRQPAGDQHDAGVPSGPGPPPRCVRPRVSRRRRADLQGKGRRPPGSRQAALVHCCEQVCSRCGPWIVGGRWQR